MENRIVPLTEIIANPRGGTGNDREGNEYIISDIY